MSQTAKSVVQVSPRGQVTLPAEVRRQLGVRAGDPLVVGVEDGRIVLSRAVVLPIEIYSDERVAEFAEAAKLSPREERTVRERWKL
jgi:AbrB family looped-hinge helix DNA binding protein